MMAVVLAIAIGALTFEPSEMPAIDVSGVQALSGEAITNYGHADLNGDGVSDLLLNDVLLIQRDGRFPADSACPLPESGDDTLLQAWDGRLYAWSDSGLRQYRLQGDTWECTADDALPRPVAGQFAPAAGLAGTRRQGFLHDCDGDGTPEAVAVTPLGVLLYVDHGEGYAETGSLSILPGMRLANRAPRSLSPPEVRRLVFPVLEMACRLVLEQDTIAVITRDTVDVETVRYTRKRYGWNSAETTTAVTETTQPLARHMHPCRLNGDGVLDFAGGRWTSSEAAMLPMPYHETWASLDGGRTVHIRRSSALPGFRPRCSFIDFDGDGDLDMVTEETGFFDGGLRETVSRLLTLPEVRHTVNVYLQRDGGFEENAAYRASFTIGLEHPAIGQDDAFMRYRAGELVDITGDFDGDGKRDLVVRDRLDRLSVHLTGPHGYTNDPHAVLSIERAARSAVADVNDDRRSDIVVHGDAHVTMVYFSRGNGA